MTEQILSLINSPAGLRARARVRAEEANLYPEHSHERRRQLLLASEYEREAGRVEKLAREISSMEDGR